MAWGCTCWANSVFGNVCITSAILGPNGHFGTHLQSRTPTCLTCAINNQSFADNYMASEEDMCHFVWQGGVHLQGRMCAHTHCAVVMLCSGIVTQGDADRVLAVTSQELKKVAHPSVRIQKFLQWCGLPFVTPTVVVGAHLLMGTDIDASFSKLASPILSYEGRT